MGVQGAGADDVVEPWDCNRAVTRTVIDTTASGEGRTRIAVFAAVVVVVVVILAVRSIGRHSHGTC